ncbi:hypothetical protein K458DRAFT_416149 [Lentithecium fluviatile CBS 122367]|uniref:Uncharacterized protein n=1 Tax=Lentithecium fluviatile CBS 122367 TaxID=1168545 RepID=A0A6G1J9B6_9PLEO|nr:hypothetical protein K458DRAFT_416149 [Lentithecium fluviatile CBS 122367]
MSRPPGDNLCERQNRSHHLWYPSFVLSLGIVGHPIALATTRESGEKRARAF